MSISGAVPDKVSATGYVPNPNYDLRVDVASREKLSSIDSESAHSRHCCRIVSVCPLQVPKTKAFVRFFLKRFGHARAARFALERAFVMIRPVGLKSREPHRHSAIFAGTGFLQDARAACALDNARGPSFFRYVM